MTRCLCGRKKIPKTEKRRNAGYCDACFKVALGASPRKVAEQEKEAKGK